MKKIGILALVLIFALGSLGIGYAHWSKSLFIVGTVDTGSLDAILSVGDSWDTEIEGKDFSSIECHLDPMDSQRLIVTVTNAYPSIDYYQEFDVTNTGTIPLHVASTDVSSGLPCGTVEITDLTSAQIHPGESAWGIIHVHLCQDAGELATYTFGATIVCDQWNWPY